MQSFLGVNPFKYTRGTDVWPPAAGLFRAGIHAFTYTIPPEISWPHFFQWYVNDPEYAVQTLYRRRVLIDWEKVKDTAKAGIIQGLWQVAVMMSLRAYTDHKYGADPQDLIAARVNSARDWLYNESNKAAFFGSSAVIVDTPKVVADTSKTAAEIGSNASLVATVDGTKFLWMNATFAWERCLKDYSYNVFFGFAASLVSLGYGVKYQLSKDRSQREWGRLVTDYIDLLFFFAGQSLGSALTAGVAYLIIPIPILVAATVWLPRIFIGRASGAAFQHFSKKYVTRTAPKPLPAPAQ